MANIIFLGDLCEYVWVKKHTNFITPSACEGKGKVGTEESKQGDVKGKGRENRVRDWDKQIFLHKKLLSTRNHHASHC